MMWTRCRLLRCLATSRKPLESSWSPTCDGLTCMRLMRTPMRKLASLGSEATAMKRVHNGAGSSVTGHFRSLNLRYPFAMAFGVCFLNGVASDSLAQSMSQQLEELQLNRIIAMALFSGSYCGCAQHFLYNVVFTQLLGSSTALWPTAVLKVALDALLIGPFVYMPTYFCFDEVLRFGSMAGLYDRWCADIWRSMCEYWKIWPPVCLALFVIVPVELRIGVFTGVSFCWQTILSLLVH
eukprot:gnl/TRDRNA2_/TRDRNA2_203454_c0_seq1.p1 gnl/TRDRNA2_/TRDRNA2_203454_c0~~gnl/TRDRNA2_/TRDRNA2_203454_c0_seq1.p1  ORF type:complete len:238 (+),score=9.40 gnl/TRDRNA2_/TRDRNA2_203454_c0_seq1:52-765(+)